MKVSLRNASSAILAVTLLLAAGCSSKTRYADDSTIHPDLDVSVAWLKNKKNTVDMRLVFRNKSSFPITYTGSSVKLSFDGRDGLQAENFVRTLLPDESEARTLIFRYEQTVAKKGIATLIVDPIYKGGTGEEGTRQTVRRYFRRFELQ